MFVALIAVLHVLFSHLTVAATWFNWYVERQALAGRTAYYDFLKASALRLLMFAYTIGAMVGVGIWFSVTANNPRGIGTLIHNFVFYWASEWFWFIIDVFGIAVYYYTFGRVSQRTHARIGLMLAFAATGTLAIIVGILGFKLSPGAWLETGQSLDGFYNPTFWPQIFARFALMFALTALYALLVLSTMPKDHPARAPIARLAGKVGLTGLAISSLLLFFWYLPSMPEDARRLLAIPNVIQPVFYVKMAVGAAALVITLLWALIAPKRIPLAWLYLTTAFVYLGLFGAERIREAVRKPDIVLGYMGSNQLIFKDMPVRGIQAEESKLNQEGVLGRLPYAVAPGAKAAGPAGGVDPLEAGKTLVRIQCSSCHTVSEGPWLFGGLRPLSELLARRGLTEEAIIRGFLEGVGGYPYMHPVVGTPEEKDYMAKYLASLVKKGGNQ
ncbi:MAG: c-type cytochrome [Thermaceae bacterium]